MKHFLSKSIIAISVCFLPNIATSDVIFNNDVESASSLGEIFNVNTYDGIIVGLSNDIAHSGSTSIKLSYPVNEAGVELKIPPFTATTTLFTRKYEYYAPGWEGNWPVGLKTSRYFTTPTYSVDSSAYMSEKLIWQTYDSTCDEEFGMGMNNAIYNLDLEDYYLSGEVFGNGMPYIRTGHWYKYETWMVLNSDVDVPDGVLKVWVDGVMVYSNEQVVWKSSTRGVPNGVGWQSMWFGGNYSGAICGGPNQTLDRYIDDLYVSTTLDLEIRPNAPVLLD